MASVLGLGLGGWLLAPRAGHRQLARLGVAAQQALGFRVLQVLGTSKLATNEELVIFESLTG